MKTNAIVRIVLFALVIVVLLGCLGIGIAAKYLTANGGFSSHTVTDGEVSSEGSVSADSVRNLTIEWVSGSITIMPGDTDEIQFTESGNIPENQQMVWKQTGNTLTIQFCKPKSFSLSSLISLGSSVTFDKDLVITVPQDWACNELTVESVSADVSVTGLGIQEAEMEGVSGKCTLTGCAASEIAVETVSGNVELDGDYTTVELNTVSGNCKLMPTGDTRSITLESVSGDVTVLFPETVAGFTASIDSVSGSITSDFTPGSISEYMNYGDGSCRIEANSVSGNVKILKAS